MRSGGEAALEAAKATDTVYSGTLFISVAIISKIRYRLAMADGFVYVREASCA